MSLNGLKARVFRAEGFSGALNDLENAFYEDALSNTTVTVGDTTDSTSPITGSMQTDGGLGVVKDVFVGGSFNTAESFVSTHGDGISLGSVGTSGKNRFQFTTNAINMNNSSNALVMSWLTDRTAILPGGNALTDLGSSAVRFSNLFLARKLGTTDLTDSTSATTGSIQTDGGLGVGKKLFVGETVTGQGFTSTNAVTGISLGGTGNAGKNRFQADAASINILSSGNATLVAFLTDRTGILPGGDAITDLGSQALRFGNAFFGGAVRTDSILDSTSAGTGSIQTDGGLGVAKNLHGGGNLTINAGGEVFLNLPVVGTGTSGSLWNDAGIVKVVP